MSKPAKQTTKPENTTRKAEPKLTEGSIAHHVIRLAIPSSLGMIFNTLYNLVDYWFAGRLSSDALAGVSIASTVFFLLIATGIGLQIGASAVIAPAVGSNDEATSRRWTREVLGLSLLASVVIMVLGWVLTESLVNLLGAEPNVAPFATTYIYITLIALPAFMIGFAAAGILMAFGDTKSNRNALALGLVLNILLNPLFMFGFGWGVAGLAISTGLIKVVTALYLLHRIGVVSHGAPPKPAFNIAGWLPLLKQVAPASFNMMAVILGGFITVALVGRFGSEHIAGYSIGLRLEQLLLLPALGMNSAVMAIGGQNFGVGNATRVYETYYTSLKLGLAMAAFGIPVMVFLSPLLMTLFSDNQDIINTGTAYLRIDAIAFYAYVMLFLSTATLQAIKQPLFPMVLGLSRHLIVPVAINVVLIVYLGFPMISVFYTLISVVVVSAITSHLFTRWRLQKLISEEEADIHKGEKQTSLTG